MSDLPTPDSNGIGRYGESDPPIPSSANGGFAEWLNKALRDISAAITAAVKLTSVWFRNSANLANSTNYQALSFDSLSGPTDFTHSAGVFTCQRAGIYEIGLVASFAANSTGSRSVRITGTQGTHTAPLTGSLSATLDTTVSVRLVRYLDVGMSFTAQAFQNSGGNLAVRAELVLTRIPT